MMKNKKLINIIKYVNLKDLTKEEKDTVKNIIENEFEKIHRLFSGNLVNLKIHTKIYRKEKRKKYSIHLKAEAPTITFSTKSVADWDLKRVTRKSIDDLKNKIKHTFKHQKNKKEALTLKAAIRKAIKL